MQFYRRFYEDGSCRVICLNCYEMLGTGLDREAVGRLESEHICREWTKAGEESGSRIHLVDATRAENPGPRPARVQMWLLLPAIALLCYGVPTALELLATVHLNTWLAVILPGDLAGCAVLAGLAKMPRTGVLLYLGLTACECCLHITHAMRGTTMVWLADLVPTLVVMKVALQGGLGTAKRRVESFS
jgi:hypothetical protein